MNSQNRMIKILSKAVLKGINESSSIKISQKCSNAAKSLIALNVLRNISAAVDSNDFKEAQNENS